MPYTFERSSKIITTLTSSEVFVFGSNLQGFHGAGSAGYAMRGDYRNNWREDKQFLEAIKQHKNRTTYGSDKLKGKWAIFGIAKGFQTGKEGTSYAIPTCIRPGAKYSITRRDIYLSLVELWNQINAQRHSIFYIPPLGEGYAGYTPEEMMEVWNYLIKTYKLPTNVQFIGRNK